MFESWIINAVAGAVGGNIAGAAMKNVQVGWLTKSIAGIVGGSGGGQIIGWAQQNLPPDLVTSLSGMLSGQTDPVFGIAMNSWASGMASGGVGGAIALYLWGYVKRMMGR
jgi:uncharacterized membrane protein YeaQ/YmgE (transglycosylase-associated protein family)